MNILRAQPCRKPKKRKTFRPGYPTPEGEGVSAQSPSGYAPKTPPRNTSIVDQHLLRSPRENNARRSARVPLNSQPLRHRQRPGPHRYRHIGCRAAIILHLDRHQPPRPPCRQPYPEPAESRWRCSDRADPGPYTPSHQKTNPDPASQPSPEPRSKLLRIAGPFHRPCRCETRASEHRPPPATAASKAPAAAFVR